MADRTLSSWSFPAWKPAVIERPAPRVPRTVTWSSSPLTEAFQEP
nr:hypothetical protein [Actinoplanes missouriensis]